MTRWAACSILAIWTCTAMQAQTPTGCKGSTEVGEGYTTIRFTFSGGDTQLIFPDAEVSGEMTTSAVAMTFWGANDQQGDRHKAALNELQIGASGKTVALKSGNIVTVAMRSGDDDSRRLTIQTANGRVLCQKLIPVRLQRRSSVSSDYEVAPFVDATDHLKIWGRFDGNLDNTKIEIGGQPVRVLAESTGELVAEIPAKTTGVLPIQITNGATSVQKVARFVSVEVVEPTQNPSKHAAKPKSATFEIRGLQRLTEPLLLEVQNHWWASTFVPKTLNPFKPRDDRWWEPRRLDPKQVNGQDPYYYEFQPKHGGIDDLKVSVFPVSAPLRVHNVVREAMAGWSSDNHIEITPDAQALIAKGFEDREDQLKEAMSGPRKYNAVPNLLLAAVVRAYLFELRDLAVGGTAPAPAFGFRFQAGAQQARTVIDRLQVMQHTVADYVRTIVSRLSGEIVPLKIDSKPQSLAVLVDSKSMGQTPTEVILSPGKYTVVIKPSRGKPLCTRPKEILPGPPDELFCPEDE